jgi:prepilin-type N-terminal cleavage/methylation domain-containing protein
MPKNRPGFTLIELLVAVAIIAILAALLLPVLGRAKRQSYQATCLSNLHQIGAGFTMLLSDNNDRFPDDRGMKTNLGYMPWTTWPTSDPRGGWAAVVLSNYTVNPRLWICPSFFSSSFLNVPQCSQLFVTNNSNMIATYWLWRFDRPDDPVPLDDFWGKSTVQALADLRTADDPTVGEPGGPADVEMTVDPYFPNTVPSLPPDLKGRAFHYHGRNRLFLDMHGEFDRDPRLQ